MPTRRDGLSFFCAPLQKVVDVCARIKQLVSDHQRSHKHQTLIADVAMLPRKLFKLGRQIFADFFEPLNLVLTAGEPKAPPVEVDRNVSQLLPTAQPSSHRTTRTSFALIVVMKRIECPINPVQGVRRALFQLGYTLPGGRKLCSEPHIFRPHVVVDDGLASRFHILGPLDLSGVAYSHGLSTPSRATRSTRVSPKV